MGNASMRWCTEVWRSVWQTGVRQESPATQKQLEELAARHAKLGLTKAHYGLFLDAFLQTVEEFGEHDPSRLAAWRTTLQRGIDFIWRCEEASRGPGQPAQA